MHVARALGPAFLALGAAATILLAEPTRVSTAVGSVVTLAGLVLRWARAAYERADGKASRAGPFAFVRNPGPLSTFLLAAGLLVLAASEGRRGRWVPRTLVPMGLLVFFAHVLPRADALERARAREPGGGGERYVAEVPALVPRLSAWRSEPASPPSLRRALGTREVVVAGAVALVGTLCLLRDRLAGVLGF
jgi:protein-S-isoprenylcysteine O-methyltransferase Ste14